MRTKFFALAASVLLMVSLSACGGSSTDGLETVYSGETLSVQDNEATQNVDVVDSKGKILWKDYYSAETNEDYVILKKEQDGKLDLAKGSKIIAKGKYDIVFSRSSNCIEVYDTDSDAPGSIWFYGEKSEVTIPKNAINADASSGVVVYEVEGEGGRPYTGIINRKNKELVKPSGKQVVVMDQVIYVGDKNGGVELDFNGKEKRKITDEDEIRRLF